MPWIIIGRREEQYSCGGRFASTANLEPDGEGLAAFNEDDLDLIAGTKLAPESDILDARQRSGPVPFSSCLAGGQGEGQMHDAWKDRLAIEVAVEAAAVVRNLEME